MYAQHAALLTDLLKGSPAKTDQLSWTDEAVQAFQHLKEILKSPIALHIPQSGLPIILHSDWSTNAIGGWISQLVDGTERPIAYESRKLRPAKKNYSPYDGELLALVHCLRTFRPYLLDRPIIVRTDQKALKWLLDQRTLSRHQYCWLDVFQELDLHLQWIAGQSNTITDALSCHPHDSSVSIQVNVVTDIDN